MQSSTGLTRPAKPIRAIERCAEMQRPGVSRPLRHLVIVAGPSAAGKSAFLDQLSGGALQSDARELLPELAAAWPQVKAAHYRRWLPPIADSDASNSAVPELVLHYDMLRLTQMFAATFNPVEDLVLGVCAHAQAITVLTIRPDRARLVRHYYYRASGDPVRTELAILLLRAAAIAPGPVKQMLLRAVKPLWEGDAQLSPRCKQVLAHYSDKEFVDGLYRDWSEAIQSLAEQTSLRMVEIAPVRWARTLERLQWRTRRAPQAVSGRI